MVVRVNMVIRVNVVVRVNVFIRVNVVVWINVFVRVNVFVRYLLPSYIITTLCVGTDIFPKICASYFNLKPPWGPPALWNPRYYLNEFHKTLWLQSVIGLAFLCW